MITHSMYDAEYPVPSAAPFRVAVEQAVLASQMVFPKSLSEVMEERRIERFLFMKGKGRLSTKEIAKHVGLCLANTRQQLLKLVEADLVEMYTGYVKLGKVLYWEWVE